MEVLIAMSVFVLSHIVIARTSLKAALIERLGERTYLAVYSALSLALLGWVISSVLAADRILLWSASAWSFGFAAVTSLLGFILIGIGTLSPNPFSVTLRKTGFDPERPGVVGWVRHPIIWGLTLWGLAHIPANGEWPSLVLFAGSAVFGTVGVFAIERRLKRRSEPNNWQQIATGPGHIDRSSLLGAIIGLALWIAFLTLHPALFGADPLAVLLTQLG